MYIYIKYIQCTTYLTDRPLNKIFDENIGNAYPCPIDQNRQLVIDCRGHAILNESDELV